jgi:hypothetical protein
MTPARPLASIVALGLAGVLIAPAPATAAPAPCEQAERYAAQSGAELLRLRKLDLSPLRSSGSGDPSSSGGADRSSAGGNGSGGGNDDSPDEGDQSRAIDADTDTIATSGDQVTRDVAIAEAKSALVGVATPSAAALTRMLSSSGASGAR